jgi:hypothetical protein
VLNLQVKTTSASYDYAVGIGVTDVSFVTIAGNIVIDANNAMGWRCGIVVYSSLAPAL